MVEAKICLLVCATGAQYYAITPPTPRPSAKERLNPTGLEVVTPWIHTLVKSIIGVCALSDIILAYATSKESTAIPQSLAALLVRSDLCSLSSSDRTTPSTALVAGCCLSVIGSAIRFRCYSTLGRFFTFELSIRQDHKLVTSGPYSIVRHPSYTGGLCVFLGVLLCHLHTLSWMVSCSGVFPSSDQGVRLTLGCLWAGLLGLLYYGLRGRIQKEEAMLQGKFGDQWKSYMNRVPYRLVPWLF